MSNKNSSVFGAMFTMIFISFLLFWLPVIGPLIAGIVGGRKAGGIFDAILVVFLPAILTAVFLAITGGTFCMLPIFAFLAGSGIFIISAINIGPLLLGAIIGGATA
jgi:hypothetical protein